MSKYLKLDLEAIRQDFPQVWAYWERDFEITPRIGKIHDWPELEEGQHIIGANDEFHFLLTKK